jgi:hypothetical protein
MANWKKIINLFCWTCVTFTNKIYILHSITGKLKENNKLIFSVKNNNILLFNWLDKLNNKLNKQISLCLIENIKLLFSFNSITQHDVLFTKKLLAKPSAYTNRGQEVSHSNSKLWQLQTIIINLMKVEMSKKNCCFIYVMKEFKKTETLTYPWYKVNIDGGRKNINIYLNSVCSY